MDILTCPFLNHKLNKEEKDSLNSDISGVYNSAILPMHNPEDYLFVLKKSFDQFKTNKSLHKIEKNIIFRVIGNYEKYVTELQKSIWQRQNIYNLETKFVNSIILFKENFDNHINKYEYKLKLLKEVGINNNKIALIEQEKYWFTKWTNFDFGLELQAKRSQEVY